MEILTHPRKTVRDVRTPRRRLIFHPFRSSKFQTDCSGQVGSKCLEVAKGWEDEVQQRRWWRETIETNQETRVESGEGKVVNMMVTILATLCHGEPFLQKYLWPMQNVNVFIGSWQGPSSVSLFPETFYLVSTTLFRHKGRHQRKPNFQALYGCSQK